MGPLLQTQLPNLTFKLDTGASPWSWNAAAILPRSSSHFSRSPTKLWRVRVRVCVCVCAGFCVSWFVCMGLVVGVSL